jgi:hypothetical protein
MPQSGQDVPDDMDARLVVLGVDHPYSKESANKAETAAQSILDTRGNSPRLFQNSLIFLAADKTRLQDLDEATRKYLAWDSILEEKLELNLDPQQVKQAETQMASADNMVTARLPETYQWLLVPVQSTPQSPVTWQALRLTGNEALALRASKKLKNDELLLTSFAGSRLRMELDKIPLWRGNHVSVRQLTEDFARYIYLPRLKDSSVLLNAIREGVSVLTWEQDTFAFADTYDEAAGRYKGLRSSQNLLLYDADSASLLVKSAVAKMQFEAESNKPATGPLPSGGDGKLKVSDAPTGKGTQLPIPASSQQPSLPTRYHGTVTLDSTRVGRDASRIAEEIIGHLTSLPGAVARITLEIDIEIPNGIPDDRVRAVNENSNTLKFKSHGFEE